MIVELRRVSPMRTAIIAASIGLAASFISIQPARSENDLVAGTPLIRNKMKEWTRSGTGKNPWMLNGNGVLSCGAKDDSYIFEELLGNGTLHVEWRFVPTATNAKKVVKASLYVRAAGESERCKISLGSADCGSIVATSTASSDRLMDFESTAQKSFAKEIGDWNTMDIKMSSTTVDVAVNGKPTASTIHAKETGILSVNAEGDPIEFRNIRWQATR